MNVVAHPEPADALRLARPALLSFARFSAMHGAAVGPTSEDDRAVLEGIPRAYDMTRHFRHREDEGAVLPASFMTRFGVVGTPADCVERLAALVALGLDRLVVVGPNPDGDGAASEAARCFLEEVAPGMRAG